MLFLIVKWYNRKTSTRQKWLKFYFLHATKLSVGLFMFSSCWTTFLLLACSLPLPICCIVINLCCSLLSLNYLYELRGWGDLFSLPSSGRCSIPLTCQPVLVLPHLTHNFQNGQCYVNSILMRYSYLSKIRAASTCWMRQLCKYNIAGMQQQGTLCSS